MKLINDSIFSSIKIVFEKKNIGAIWYNSKNWGDALSPVLIRHLSGLDPIQITKYTIIPKNYQIYIAIGSLLDMELLCKTQILKNLIIWGTGFISHSGRLSGKPKKICSVRGPLTRENILKSGLNCPEIYGDPALLYPKIYKPNIIRKYKLGIVPHYVDKKDNCLKQFFSDSDIKIIDIENPINQVVDEICSCRYIASSSLHGIIAADAYNIPSVWLSISDKIVGKDFKFLDYFASVGRSDTQPLKISEKTSVDSIYNEFYNYKIDIDLMEMLAVCPFLFDNQFK
jgi:pyruvyltransferase